MKSREDDTIPDGSKHTGTYRTDQTSQPDLKETAAEKNDTERNHPEVLNRRGQKRICKR